MLYEINLRKLFWCVNKKKQKDKNKSTVLNEEKQKTA